MEAQGNVRHHHKPTIVWDVTDDGTDLSAYVFPVHKCFAGRKVNEA